MLRASIRTYFTDEEMSSVDREMIRFFFIVRTCIENTHIVQSRRTASLIINLPASSGRLTTPLTERRPFFCIPPS